MVTVKDIAAAANISHPAVSAVLNGRAKKARIGKDTTQRVLKIARELGYKPNMMAKALRTGKTFSIGILLPAPHDNFYARLIGQLEKELANTLYTSIFAFWSSVTEMSRAAQTILDRQVDGIITVEPDKLPDNLTIPVVSLFHDDKKNKCDNVKLDRDHMFDLGIGYLHNLGHRRIMKPDCHETSTHVNSLFRNTLAKYGLSDRWMFSLMPGCLACENLTTSSDQILDVILKEKDAPTAVIMPNDNSAITLMAAAWRRGIKVPDQISVIGSDNISIGSSMIPPLNTFDFENERNIAESLLEILMKRLEDSRLPRQEIYIKPKLVVRGSCARIKI